MTITLYCLAAFDPALKGVIRDIRVAWALEELGLPYERKVLDGMKGEHKRPEFLQLNPFGKVPTVLDGETSLFESSAIITYYADKTGKLIPAPTSKERPYYNQWTACAISTIEPMAFQVFGADLFKRNVENRENAAKAVNGYFGVLDKHLETRSYLLGEDFGVADVIMGSVARIVQHTPLANDHKHFKAYLDRCYERAGFKAAFAKNGEA